MPVKKTSSRDQEAMQKLFEQRSYVGGRLPQILDPAPPPPAPINDNAQPIQIIPTWEPIPRGVEDERPKRKARSEKASGLQIILHSIQRDGFPHPLTQGGFLMLPKVFKALL